MGGGGGGKDVVDSLVSGDFNIVSPDAAAVLLPPDIGGRGGGAESHLVRKIGSNSDDNTMIRWRFYERFVVGGRILFGVAKVSSH